MSYKRIRTRIDYFCPKTKRMQVKMMVDYHLLNPSGDFTGEIIPAKHWQAFRRKLKNQRRAA